MTNFNCIFRLLMDVNKWMSYECSDEGIQYILRTFITHLLIHIHQKKIALEIATQIESLNINILVTSPPPLPPSPNRLSSAFHCANKFSWKKHQSIECTIVLIKNWKQNFKNVYKAMWIVIFKWSNCSFALAPSPPLWNDKICSVLGNFVISWSNKIQVPRKKTFIHLRLSNL